MIYELGSEFTPDGLKKLKQGQVLVYEFEGTRTELKITKINRKSHKLYARQIRLYKPEEVDIVEKEKT